MRDKNPRCPGSPDDTSPRIDEERVEQHIAELRESNRRLRHVIKQQKQATEVLNRSEHLLQQAFNSMGSGVIVLGSKGEVLLINRAALSLLRLQEDITGQVLNEALPSSDALLKDTSSRDQAEAVIKLKDGTNRLLGYSSSPAGAEGCRVVVFRDITEIVENKQRRRRADELALVGEMISRLSHEIKNPLASIVVGLKTLQRGTPQSSAHAHIVQLLSEEVDSLAKIVNQLLESARPKTPTPRPVYVEPLLERCIDANGLLAVRRGVTLELVRFPSSSAIIMDDQAMLRVLANLVQNALDACSKGDRIRIGWQELDKAGKDGLVPGFSGNVVCLFVEDTGAGIPEELSSSQSHVFKAFVSSKAAGTGLGLTVARDIVESQGGVIVVDSLLNRGTRVEILLPVPKPIPCWDWQRDRATDCPSSEELDCANCEVRSTGTGYCCWTLKGQACHMETGQWPEPCLKCGFFRASSLTPFFRSRLVPPKTE